MLQIVLVDEATAHMDAKTRDRLFSLLAANLPLCTLLSIVHRPHSLSDYDYGWFRFHCLTLPFFLYYCYPTHDSFLVLSLLSFLSLVK